MVKTNVDLVRENIRDGFQHQPLLTQASLENIMFAPLETRLMTREEAQKSVGVGKVEPQIKPMPIKQPFRWSKITMWLSHTWTLYDQILYI